jgi:putative holin Dp-1
LIKDNKLYDRLKFIAQVLLPALGTLYFTLAGIWNLPSAEQVVGTIVAIDTFLGVILHISSAQYNGTAMGTLAVHEENGKTTYNLELEGDPEYELEGKDRVVFKIDKGGI